MDHDPHGGRLPPTPHPPLDKKKRQFFAPKDHNFIEIILEAAMKAGLRYGWVTTPRGVIRVTREATK